MTYQTLKIKQQSAVLTVQLCRPDARNSINVILLDDLLSALRTAEDDATTKMIVLEGLPDVFCTGMDFREYVESGDFTYMQVYKYFDVLRHISHCSKIIISKVYGLASAGGVGIVAASDLVIAKDTASFALPELLFSLLPASVLPFLIRRVGYQKAGLLALSTQTISAAEAYRWGLVDEYGPDPKVLLRPYLRRWHRLSPASIGNLKAYMNQLYEINTETQELAAKTISDLMVDPQIRNGIRHFVEEGVVPWKT